MPQAAHAFHATRPKPDTARMCAALRLNSRDMAEAATLMDLCFQKSRRPITIIGRGTATPVVSNNFPAGAFY